MKLLLTALTGALVLAPMAHAQTPADPFNLLEEVEAPKILTWVEGQNARSAKRLETDSRYATYLAEGRAIVAGPATTSTWLRS